MTRLAVVAFGLLLTGCAVIDSVAQTWVVERYRWRVATGEIDQYGHRIHYCKTCGGGCTCAYDVCAHQAYLHKGG